MNADVLLKTQLGSLAQRAYANIKEILDDIQYVSCPICG